MSKERPTMAESTLQQLDHAKDGMEIALTNEREGEDERTSEKCQCGVCVYAEKKRVQSGEDRLQNTCMKFGNDLHVLASFFSLLLGTVSSIRACVCIIVCITLQK